MGFVLVALLFYPVWGFFALVIFNCFYTRYAFRQLPALKAAGRALAVNLLVFTPLLIPTTSFFGDVYLPWYVAPFMGPPLPEFSFMGLSATLLASIVSIALVFLFTKKRV